MIHQGHRIAEDDVGAQGTNQRTRAHILVETSLTHLVLFEYLLQNKKVAKSQILRSIQK